MTQATRAGFTLIELSISLIIIGLLVGGVLGGQTLIRQSQINSVMVDAQRYMTAAGNFSTKYGALPGDMSNATATWGAMTSCPPSAGGSSAGGTLTCDGNGDGQIYNPATSGTQNTNESLLFWQHLVDAQFITGNYSGIGGSGGTLDHILGTNAPSARADGSGFGIMYAGIRSGDTNFFNGSLGHVFVFGSHSANNLPVTAIMTTSEAVAFDKKFDDGLPAYGNIQSWKNGGYNANCTSSTASTATYSTGSSGVLCSLIFKTGF